MRLLVNHIHLEHTLGRRTTRYCPYLQSRFSSEAVAGFDCPSHCWEKHTCLLDVDVCTQTQQGINYFWRKTFPFCGYCRAMCLSAFKMMATSGMQHSRKTPSILLCGVVWTHQRGAALVSLIDVQCVPAARPLLLSHPAAGPSRAGKSRSRMCARWPTFPGAEQPSRAAHCLGIRWELM